MIKLNKDYSDYTDDTDDAYPAGKAVGATTEESIDGTPYLEKWMNNIHGAFTALWVKAFGSVEGMSGKPDSVDHSDVLLAVEKLIERPLSLHSDTRGANSHGATSAAAAGQIVTRDQVGRAKVTAPVEGDDIAQLQQVIAEAEARTSADTAEAEARISADETLQHNIDVEAQSRAAADTAEANARTSADTAEAQTRLSADNALSGRINQLSQYRTYETNTGKTWTGGQAIYRRCFDTSAADHQIGAGLNMVRLFNTSPDNSVQWYTNHYDSDDTNSPIYNRSTGILLLRGYGSFSSPMRAIVEYFK